ncbi:hydroxyisourate hydrolase [Streptomyces netropsis]|uniref:5-hydroxyisourate hydrolase n=1 Tax=Streptomyces netropsis TaxID=55404 RepID=A0A7W7LE05_STRNE|nr:hydroxyisourate hydrolase [Streptomyces netropsis]MBB4888459.1 5-hydroxyisourate hydrolase [Streptomyces netropsis]GGR29142.1 5-hydroxyisourate hydrolase [Streptomyces netropsis]
MSSEETASVSTHILDTSTGSPAGSVAVELSARGDSDQYRVVGHAKTDADGRCKDLPALPEGTTHARLTFSVEPYLARSQAAGAAFFPEVTVAFAVTPGEHYHLPLLLNPFGYSVYRGS